MTSTFLSTMPRRLPRAEAATRRLVGLGGQTARARAASEPRESAKPTDPGLTPGQIRSLWAVAGPVMGTHVRALSVEARAGPARSFTRLWARKSRKAGKAGNRSQFHFFPFFPFFPFLTVPFLPFFPCLPLRIFSVVPRSLGFTSGRSIFAYFAAKASSTAA